MLIWLFFVIVLGACVGSFLNVVIYRIPAGRSIVSPPSACPKCGHRLAWYDNVPVLGWLWLRGRCRYCASAISPQYPLIEAATAGLFGGWFYVCYISGLRPDFTPPEVPEATAIIFIVNLALLGGLVASTLIDARLFIIPLQIPWFVTGVALVMLPVGVWLFPGAVQRVELPPVLERVTETQTLRAMAQPYGRSGAVESAVQAGRIGSVTVTAAPWASERMTGAAIGAAVLLVIANVLLKRGVLPLSFPPPPPEVGEGGAAEEELKESPHGVGAVALLLIPLAATAIAAGVIDASWHGSWVNTMPLHVLGGSAAACYLLAMIGMLAVSVFLRGRQKSEAADDAEHFEPFAGARGEMLKEILFVAFPVVGAVIGWWVAGGVLDTSGGGGGSAPSGQPLYGGAVNVVGGVLLGYLVVAGLVWGVRIGGTLGFGKEAMGLGDVHLMGAVGAVCGWEVGVLAFFLAPFAGLAHTVVSLGAGKVLRLQSRQIPYGPHLAVGTVTAMVLREPLVAYFGVLLAGR